MTPPLPSGDIKLSCFSAVMPVIGWNQWVKWPPKDKLYAEYSEKLLAYAMTIWGKELETYNVEDLYANTSEPKGSARR